MTEEQLLDDMVQAIVSRVDPERIILFGSRARGVSFPKTHDLKQLFALVEEHGGVVPDELGGLVDLTDFAVKYR